MDEDRPGRGASVTEYIAAANSLVSEEILEPGDKNRRGKFRLVDVKMNKFMNN